MALVETHKGIDICTFDVPCTPFVWVHEERDAQGFAPDLETARQQIDAHWSRMLHQVEPHP